MKNLNLITCFYLLIAPVLCFTSSTTLAQKPDFDFSDTSPLSYDDQFLKAEDAFNVDFNQQGNKLKISFAIAPGYYLYRHRFNFKSNKLIVSPAELPLGITHQDEFFGIQQIYKKQLSFTLDIKKTSKNASIEMTYQGCAEKGLCYPPTTKTVMINEISTHDMSENKEKGMNNDK